MNEFLQIFISIIGAIAGCYVVFIFYERMAGAVIRNKYNRLIVKYPDLAISDILLKTLKSRFVFKKFSDDVCRKILQDQGIQNIDELWKFLGACEKYFYKVIFRKGYFFTKIDPEIYATLEWRGK